MQFKPTQLKDVYVVNLEKKTDDRGWLARTWDKTLAGKLGYDINFVQAYTCQTSKQGTLRGFHYTKLEHNEYKLNRVIRGSLYEVIVDLRPD